jgi:hypothetical protein
MGLAVLGVALATPGVMLIGSLVESLYCSLSEGQRVAADRISLEPISSGVAYGLASWASLWRPMVGPSSKMRNGG